MAKRRWDWKNDATGFARLGLLAVAAYIVGVSVAMAVR